MRWKMRWKGCSNMQRRQTEPYISKYLHRKGRQMGLPIGGNFELTARCNFNCPMCYVHLSQENVEARGKELTAEQWIRIAQEARDQGMVFALLTGGEPFVRKDFFEIYSAMKKMGLMVSINSNGSMLSGEIRRRLLEDPPFRVNISLYGGSNDTYRRMCGQPAFEQVVENIRALKDGGVQVRINLSITPYNRQDLRKIYAVAEEMDIPIKAASYMYPPIRVDAEQHGGGNRLSPEDAAECSVQWDMLRFTDEEFDLRAQNMMQLCSDEESECMAELEEGIMCRAGSSAFWITWDGKMLPCGMMTYPEVDLVKLGFRDAWQEIRQKTQELRMPGQCSACSRKDVCAVCPAVCVTETGKFDAVPQYMCQMTDATIRKTREAYLGKKDGHNGK